MVEKPEGFLKRVWHKRAGKVAIIAIGLVLVLVLAFAATALYFTQSSFGLFRYENPYNLPGAPVPGSAAEIRRNGQRYIYNQDVVNVLLLGVDGGEEDMTPRQADTIILLSLNKKTGRMDMLPIPRDIEVPIMHYDLGGNYAYTEPGPVCTAHSFGADREMGGQLMTATVSYLMYNIPVSRFVSVGMDAISLAANFVGGVPVQVKADFEEVAGVPAGQWLTLDGEMAELYVRARSLTTMDGSNLSRMVRQREFLFALLDVVKSRTKESLLFPFRMYGELAPYITTNLSLHELVFCGFTGLQNSDAINLHVMEGDSIPSETEEVQFAVDESFLQQYVLDICYLPVDEAA